MRLSTPGAVLGAGALVLVGLLFHAAFPRYEVRSLADGSLVRIDRWTATSDRATAAAGSAWAATTRTGLPDRVSAVTLAKGGLLVLAASGLASWRARRAWRAARVRRRLYSMVSTDAHWIRGMQNAR